MGWIDDLLGIEVQDDGVDVGQRKRLNFIGADVSEDIANDRIDVVIGGVGDWKESARLCPVAALPAYTRTTNDILADANGALPNLDGVAAQVDDVVLLVAAATASDIDNGLWRVTSLGAAGAKWAMTREATSNETGEITPQMTVRVEAGTVNASRMFYVETTGVITLNTTPISIVDSVITTPLVTATVRGSVSPFGATANTIFCSDGATAGGVWRAFVNIGTAPPAAGDVRLSHGSTFRGLDDAGVGEAQVLDWGSTLADHMTLGSNDADLDGVDIVAGAAGEFDVRVGAATNLRVAALAVTYPGNPTHNTGTGAFTCGGALTKNHATDQFASSVANPTYSQADNVAVGGAGALTTIRGQNCTGGGASVGATVLVQSGSGATNGYIGFDIAATRRLTIYDWGDVAFAGQPIIESSVVSPVFSQWDTSVDASTGYDFVLAAMGVSGAAGTSVSGNLGLRGGQGSVHAGNLDGNVWFHAAPASWNSTEKGLFVGDCVTPPAGNPVSGVYVYSQGGAAKVRGSGGTVTTFGPSAPHCAECGYDFWDVVAENERFGARLLKCGWCGHTHREGPETVHHLLSADELASRI